MVVHVNCSSRCEQNLQGCKAGKLRILARVDFDKSQRSCQKMAEKMTDFAYDSAWTQSAKAENFQSIAASESMRYGQCFRLSVSGGVVSCLEQTGRGGKVDDQSCR